MPVCDLVVSYSWDIAANWGSPFPHEVIINKLYRQAPSANPKIFVFYYIPIILKTKGQQSQVVKLQLLASCVCLWVGRGLASGLPSPNAWFRQSPSFWPLLSEESRAEKMTGNGQHFGAHEN
jgi:hypothetical protein